MTTSSRRFRIALSFPGEHRPFVEKVAEHLSAAVGRERVLYDRYYEAEFARVDLDVYLQRLYHDESELIAVFLCADYERKEWCGLEWRALRDLIKRRQASSVMPLRFDATEIPGLFSIDGYIWIGDRSPEDIAERILERWRLNSGQPAPAVEPPAKLTEPVEVKWADELRIYGEGFVGRKEELAALDRAWAEGVRIFALHAEGGAGKTRVVVEWLRRMSVAGWRGARKVFVYSFYLQGSGERRNASSEPFFVEALKYFGYRKKSSDRAGEQGRALTPLLVEHQGLLILDGLEPLQQPVQHIDRGKLKDPGIARLLLSMANVPRNERRCLCLITSRQPVVELQGRIGETVIQRSLDHLHRNYGAKLLQKFKVAGSVKELRLASDEFHGHAYSLMLLGSYLKKATDHHDIRRRREVVLLEEDVEYQSYARKMFEAYVRHLGEKSPEVAVLRLLGFFDRAADRQLLDVLMAPEAVVYEWSKDVDPADKRPQRQCIEDSLAEVTAPLLNLSQPQRNRVLDGLCGLRLIRFSGSATSSAVDAHPLLREYFAEHMRTQFPAAWQAGHKRLSQHLSSSVPYWPRDALGLQPLYQAVAHGCLAGLHEQTLTEVYRARILRGQTDYSITDPVIETLIAVDLGALAYFFATPWTALAPSLRHTNHAWLFSEAAFRLRALGRHSEAFEPLRSALSIALETSDFRNAAIRAGHLSQLEFTRGIIEAAVAAGEDSVKYADFSGVALHQIYCRALLAEALLQAGQQAKARRFFGDAESRQAKHQLRYPRLYSLPGFWYCDFLLSGAECAAWRRSLFTPAIKPIKKNSRELLACDTVLARAREWVDWRASSDSLLEIGLVHLILARATFIKTAYVAGSVPHSAVKDIDDALRYFREAGAIDFLPRGLLTRAWFRYLTGNEAGSREDLDDAWEIAERGPMPLVQADIQLYSARLFRDRAALEEARRLIEKHGYHRRDGELADALAAAEGW